MISVSEMGSNWRKAKLALGLNLCVYAPPGTVDDDSPPTSEKCSDAVLLPPSVSPGSGSLGSARESKRLSKSPKVCNFVILFYRICITN